MAAISELLQGRALASLNPASKHCITTETIKTDEKSSNAIAEVVSSSIKASTDTFSRNSVRRVLFSTPLKGNTPGQGAHSAGKIPCPFGEAEPLPPYTPVNPGLPGMKAIGQNGYLPAHFLVPDAPMQPANMLQSNPPVIYPGVLAASEALRINLGIDQMQTGPLVRPVLQTAPIPMPLLAGLPDVYNKISQGPTPQNQLLASLYPSPGQTQPCLSQSPNLPPM